jgi:hypothetical protein
MTAKSQDIKVRFGQMQALWEDGERIFTEKDRLEL